MADAKMAARGVRAEIHRALPDRASGRWATSQAVASVLGRGYSTVTEHLRAMAEAGEVESTKSGRSTVYRKLKASPKLRGDEVITRRAATVAPGSTSRAGGGDGRTAKQAARARRNRATADKVRSGSDAAYDQLLTDEEAYENELNASFDDLAADPEVWVAIVRRGITYHVRSQAVTERTLCGRSTMAGRDVRLSQLTEGSPCGTCFEGREPEGAAAAPEPAAATDPPQLVQSPNGGDLAAVVGFMESARPVSAPPATQAGPKRARRETVKPDRTYARGELRDLVLAHLRGLAEGSDATPGEIKRAVGAPYTGPISSNLARMVDAGTAVRTSETPARYRAG